MKIVLLLPGGIDSTGAGREIPALRALARELAVRHEVRVLLADQEIPAAGGTALDGFHLAALGSRRRDVPPGNFLRRLARLTALLRGQGRPDVIHAFWAGSTGAAAALAGRLLRIPTVVSLGGGELAWLPEIGYGGQGRRAGRWLVGAGLGLAGRVTAGSRYALAPLLRRRPDARWVPLGVDGRLFPAEAIGEDRRGESPRPDGGTGLLQPPSLLQVGSLNRVKDPETLLRAFRIILERRPDARLDHVGEDTLDGAPRRLAEALGLAGRVTFHGFLPLPAILPFYRRAHLYIQSSRHESQGVAVLEAAASGLPTAGSAVGLVAELAPAAAVAVPPADPPALAGAVLAVLDDPERRRRLGEAARAWSLAHDAAWTARAFERLYAEAPARGRGADRISR